MSSRSPVAAVVFDLGNVLIPWNPRLLYRKLIDDKEKMEWFLANVCTRDWNETHDSGRPFSDGIAELTPKFPDYADLIRAYGDRWDEMLGPEIGENVALMKEISNSGKPVYALTNWPAEKFPIARERYAFLKLFDGIVVSGEEGCRKPSPEIFRILTERYRLDPARTVFIDDTAGHIAAARELGFIGIRYEDPAQLRREISGLGLL